MSNHENQFRKSKGKQKNSLEGVALGRLLHCLQHIFVDPERNRTEQDQQRDVREDADEREQRHGDQDREAGAEHDARLLDIAPVDQRFHWK